MTQPSFGETAQALREMATFDRAALHLHGVAELRGRGLPATASELAAWRRRIQLVEGAAELLTILIPHEQAVRGLDPQLTAETGARLIG
jgi:hypothetical protein